MLGCERLGWFGRGGLLRFVLLPLRRIAGLRLGCWGGLGLLFQSLVLAVLPLGWFLVFALLALRVLLLIFLLGLLGLFLPVLLVLLFLGDLGDLLVLGNPEDQQVLEDLENLVVLGGPGDLEALEVQEVLMVLGDLEVL